MLDVTRGFNHGPNDERFEAGDKIPEGKLPVGVEELLLTKGVLVPVEEAPTVAQARKKAATPSTPAPELEGATEPQTDGAE